jgi:hypothetical protein
MDRTAALKLQSFPQSAERRVCVRPFALSPLLTRLLLP